MPAQALTPESFQSFGDLLKYLRRRERLTQLELSITVGYSEAQISRLEQNQRLPDLAALKALFIPALRIENEPEMTARFLELAQSARQDDAPAPGIAPYKGLLFFDESDADLFFGREALTARLADRVTDLVMDASSRFLAVVGASGSGKSSLVRAGLAVTLKSAGWDVHIFTPTADPIKALDAQFNSNHAKAKPERVLIIVDQFEETFTLCRDEAVRIAFIEKLLELAAHPSLPLSQREMGTGQGKITVVIALRADFYAHCAQYPLLRQAVAAQQEYIGQMTTEELRRAIEEPAKRGGWNFEPGLVETLLRDIGVNGVQEPEPGALPLLSHALLATWERRRGHTFMLDGYRASGGVRGAIAETAECVFTDQLNQSQQKLARDVFLRLTELGEGTEDTRRRAALNELVHQSGEATQLRAVLNTLAEARLITLNEDSAEVAHEALIREWQRLHEWLTQDREGLHLHRHLTESTREWEIRGHDAGELYRGARLAQAQEWVSANAEGLNESERAFLAASLEQEQRDALEVEAQRQRELDAAQRLAETQSRAAQQLRRRAVFLAGVLVLAIVLAGFALFFGRQASTNAKDAQEQQQIALGRELSASAINNLSVDPERSILLSLQAVNTSIQNGQPVLVEAQDALHRSIQTSRVTATLHGHARSIFSVVVSPDGKRMATMSDDGTIKIWDAASDKELLTIPTGLTEQNVVRFISFSPDGKRLAASAGVHLVKVWDLDSGKELLTLSGHTGEVLAVAYSPNGALIATGSLDTTAKLWDAATGKELMTLTGQANDVATLAFSRDGSRLYTASDSYADGVAIAWDIATGNQLFTFDGPGGIESIAVSPDGTHLVTGDFDTNVKIWDAATGKRLFTLFGHTSYINTVVYSPDGKRIASTSEDGTTRLWDSETGEALLTLSGHTSGVLSVAFSPDGNRLYTSSRDETVKIWDVSPTAGSDWMNLAGHTSRIGFVTYSPDGTRLATFGRDGTAKVWDAINGKILLTIAHGDTGGSGDVSYSPDGSRLVVAGGTDAKIFDAVSGAVILSLTPFKDNVCSILFSPDGTRLAAGSEAGLVRIYDSVNGKILVEFTASPTGIGQIAFSPDGKRIATANNDGATVWEISTEFTPIGAEGLNAGVATGKKLLTFTGHGKGVGTVGIAFSPDGKLVATSGNDATIRVWNSETGVEVYTLTGHTGPTFAVAFSPDGTRLASSSVDRTIKIWTLSGEGGQVETPLTLYGHTAAVYWAAFSPDGSRLASVGRNPIVRIFTLNIDDLIAVAKSRLTRELTQEECQKYLHVEICPAAP